jgi:protein-S-isoprenylcysteine O-methyltransferase Ste14
LFLPPLSKIMKNRIKVNGFFIFFTLLVCSFFIFKLIRHTPGPGDDFMEILGIGFILFGQLLRVSSRGYKAERSRSGHSLITDGPYSLVRNPMYLGIILIGAGVVLFVFHLWVIAIFALVFVLRYVHVIIGEEKVLLNAFGEEYKDYMRRVPRLLPKPSLLFKNDIADFLPVKLSWFKRELPSILIVLSLVLIVESWEEIRAGGWGITVADWLTYLLILLVYFILIAFLAGRYERIAKENKN